MFVDIRGYIVYYKIKKYLISLGLLAVCTNKKKFFKNYTHLKKLNIFRFKFEEVSSQAEDKKTCSVGPYLVSSHNFGLGGFAASSEFLCTGDLEVIDTVTEAEAKGAERVDKRERETRSEQEMMRGIGGPLLCIGDLLSDVGEENIPPIESMTPPPLSPSSSFSHDSKGTLQPPDLPKLFQVFFSLFV